MLYLCKLIYSRDRMVLAQVVQHLSLFSFTS
nr:MAG TPA: hypothetical protein [Caudoviricetes sp.]